MYQYSGLDKVASISEGEKVISSYQYSISGQLASATTDGATESFLWDGLALIRRGDTDYTNEPYVTGGNPLLSSDGKIMFNDVLGNTVGIKSEDKLKLIQMTAFGETADKDAFFTGKPAVNNLGYSFLFRNYRADQGKWLSQDLMDYPDGWNNLAYCNNKSTQFFDKVGNDEECIIGIDVIRRYRIAFAPLDVQCDTIGENYYLYTLTLTFNGKLYESALSTRYSCSCDGSLCHGIHNVSPDVGAPMGDSPFIRLIYTTSMVSENEYAHFVYLNTQDMQGIIIGNLNDWSDPNHDGGKPFKKYITVKCE